MYARFALAALLVLIAGCGKPQADVWQGYIEGEFVQLAVPYAGQLQKLYVQRGDHIETGKPVSRWSRKPSAPRGSRPKKG